MIKATFKGTFGKDPEIKRVGADDIALLNFSVATERQAKVDGKYTKVTDWIYCTAWGQKAEAIEKWFGKGGQIIIHGTFETRSWETADGDKRYGWAFRVDDFEFVGRKDKGNGSAKAEPEDDYEDIPF